MKNTFKPNRRSIRILDYDYTQEGFYFVTICAFKWSCLFGDIVKGQVILNDCGLVLEKCWHAVPEHFDHIELDEFVIMPNHFHGILYSRGTACRARTETKRARTETKRARTETKRARTETKRARTETKRASTEIAPLGERFGESVRGSIPTIIRSFKSAVTKRVNEIFNTPGGQVWHKNYYEHVVRDEKDLLRVREYVVNNPLCWEKDEYYL